MWCNRRLFIFDRLLAILFENGFCAFVPPPLNYFPFDALVLKEKPTMGRWYLYFSCWARLIVVNGSKQLDFWHNWKNVCLEFRTRMPNYLHWPFDLPSVSNVAVFHRYVSLTTTNFRYTKWEKIDIQNEKTFPFQEIV